MSAEIVLEPAYVIHSRPYRETSLIVDFFTENAGRISAVAKGVRRPKSPLKSLLQPFNALLISVVGKRELKTLTHVEATTLGSLLRGKRLLAALYLNELIFRALPRFDPHLALFKVYADVLLVLRESDDPIEPQLRYFELKLLADLGYALSLDVQAHSDLPIKEKDYYLFQSGHGFVKHDVAFKAKDNPFVFLGADLLAFANKSLDTEALCLSAKRLMRIALQSLLGEKAINTRLLFLEASKESQDERTN